MLSIKLFGRLSWSVDGVRYDTLGGDKWHRMVAYVAYQNNEATKDNVINECWGLEREHIDEVRTFTNTVNKINQRLMEMGLPARSFGIEGRNLSIVKFKIEISVDVRLFKMCLRQIKKLKSEDPINGRQMRSRLQEVRALYTGDLLIGLEDLSWVKEERKKLKNQFEELKPLFDNYGISLDEDLSEVQYEIQDVDNNDSIKALDSLDSADPKDDEPTSFELQYEEKNTVFLGAKDTHICIIDGNGVTPYAVQNIICRKDDRELQPPDELRATIEAIAEEQERRKAQSLPYAWNGKMAHIERFNFPSTPDDELPILDMTIRTAQYYHFLATTGALYNDFALNGYESPLRKKLLGDFDNWRFDTPPNIVNGLPVNLMIATQDGQLVFSQRSATVAIAPNTISSAINENLHPDHDHVGSNKYDFYTLVRRALTQEVGWDAFNDTRAEVFLLNFAIDIARVSYGVFGYVRLPISMSELSNLFRTHCPHRFETSHLLPVPFTVKGVCKFIHDNNLYNGIGVMAMYALLHNGAARRSIEQEFRKLQADDEAKANVQPNLHRRA